MNESEFESLADRTIAALEQAASGPRGHRIEGRITEKILDDVPQSQWWNIALGDEKAMGELEAMKQQYDESKKRLDTRFHDKVDKLQRGDELPPGVMKMVKVFVAVKRKIQPGDKMAGRHGNKGVVSRIVPIEPPGGYVKEGGIDRIEVGMVLDAIEAELAK